MTRDKIDVEVRQFLLVKTRRLMTVAKSLFDLAKERKESHVGSKESDSSGCLGCFPWYVFPLSTLIRLISSW